MTDAEGTLSATRVLISGARGFLGSHLCDHLVESGAEVHATSRAEAPYPRQDCTWWRTDLQDVDELRKVLGKAAPDVIFHLAGHVTGAPGIEQVLPTYHGLLTSTVNLLTAAADLGCRRIVVIGSLNEPLPGRLDTPPSSPYAAAKWAATAYGRMFHALYGTPVVIVRPFMVYGPRQHESKLVPYVIRTLLDGEAPKLSQGSWETDWIYISDLIEGLARAATVEGLEGCTFDLASGVLTSVRGVVEKIVAIMGSGLTPAFGALPDRPLEEMRRADMAYTQKMLHWSPSVDLDEGLARTVDWHRGQSKP